MKNEDQNLNTRLSNEEENLNIDQISQSKNNFDNNKDTLFNDFEADLNISDIVNNNDFKPDKNLKNIKQFENTSIDKSIGEDVDNLNKINLTNMEINESSMQNEQLDTNNEINNDNKILKKKRTKEDLNNTPLPLFDCLYCANEKIVFRHFINKKLSDKYLLLSDKYLFQKFIYDLDKLICNKRLINKDDKNEKLLNLVIKNTEYIKIYFSKEKSINYLKSNIFKNLCQKNEIDHHKLFKQKIEDSIVRKKKDFYFKGINKIPKNSLNNKGLFNSTNSLINNFNVLSGLVEPNVNNNIKNNFTIATCSNNSINFNSLSLNNNDFNCYYKDNNNMLDYIVEKIEKNEESVNYADDKEEILDFFKFDLSRKITKKDLKWENKYYDIWNPNISSDFEENDNNYDESELNSRNNNISEETKNKSININISNINVIKNINTNKSTNKSAGYIKYNLPKKSNLIFTFNKNKEKKDKNNNNSDINKNITKEKNNNNKNTKDKINKSKNNSIIKNEINNSKEKQIKMYQNYMHKSTTNLNINKSHYLSKFSNKYLNNYYNYNNNYNNSHKKFLSGISNIKSLGSTINSSYNINKSANFAGKSCQKIKFNNKKNTNGNSKLLQYFSSSKNNNNSSLNYSIGVSINLKDKSSIKSNGIINCLNSNKTSFFHINENKILKNNSNILYNKKKAKQNIDNKKNLFNIFNNLNINLDNLKLAKKKSNYKSKQSSKSTGKGKIKNQNKYKNNSIHKKNIGIKKNVFNISIDKQKGAKIMHRTNDLLYSSNSIFNKIHNDGLYAKSLGLSFGTNDDNIRNNNANVVFNSISNLNKSNSNFNNSNNSYYININYDYSPYKFNKSCYFNKEKKDSNNKTNGLISLINNKGNNEAHHMFYLDKNKIISNFKNKSIYCFKSTSYLDKFKSKRQKNIFTNKSNYS